jgi:hypothetical protein
MLELFTYNNTGPIQGHDDRFNTLIKGRRHLVYVEKWAIGTVHQCLYDIHGWVTSTCSYLIISLSFDFKQWFNGYDYCWYDGPHHSLQLGPLLISWS